MWRKNGSLYGNDISVEVSLMNELIEEFGIMRKPTLKELGHPAMAAQDSYSASPLPDSDFYGDCKENICLTCDGRGYIRGKGQCNNCFGLGREPQEINLEGF